MSRHFIFNELADLLASMDPEKVIAFHTSEKAQTRLDELLEKNKENEGLSDDEHKEVEYFMLLEHIISLAKARALKILSQRQTA
jgi:hypothetical protein